MTDTVVSDAVRFPQDEGIGSVSNGQETWHSAGNVATLAALATTGGAYIHTGLEFTNHDGSAITVTAGTAFVLVEDVLVQSSTTHVDDYDTQLPHDVPVSLIVPSDQRLTLESGANALWLAYATDDSLTDVGVGDVYVRFGADVSAPAHPHVKLGEADASNPRADTRPSDAPEGAFDVLVSNESRFRPEVEPPTPSEGCVRWYDVEEQAFKVKFDDGESVTIAER